MDGDFNHAAMTQDGKFVLAFSSDLRNGPTVAKVHEVDTRRVVAILDVKGILHGAAFSPDGRHVITLSSAIDKPQGDDFFYIPGRQPGWFRAWDWRSAQPLYDPIQLPSEPVGIAYNPDGARAVVVCGGGQVLILNSTTGAILHQAIHGSSTQPNSPVLQPQAFATFSPDGQDVPDLGRGATRQDLGHCDWTADDSAVTS